MDSRNKALALAALTLLKAHMAFRKKATPEGDEYARRALVALKYLRKGNIERCRKWAALLVVN
jgi:hypothetical protein